MKRTNKKVVSGMNNQILRYIDDKNVNNDNNDQDSNNNFDINVYLNESDNRKINNPSLNKCENTGECKSDDEDDSTDEAYYDPSILVDLVRTSNSHRYCFFCKCEAGSKILVEF
jgi:hypothetical protein